MARFRMASKYATAAILLAAAIHRISFWEPTKRTCSTWRGSSDRREGSSASKRSMNCGRHGKPDGSAIRHLPRDSGSHVLMSRISSPASSGWGLHDRFSPETTFSAIVGTALANTATPIRHDWAGSKAGCGVHVFGDSGCHAGSATAHHLLRPPPSSSRLRHAHTYSPL